MSENDKLAEAIADSVNSDSDRKVAYFLDEEDSPTEVEEWVSTGSTVLDLIISNRKEGGLPVGKIVEVFGPEGSGKSVLASHILANTQKMGGVPIYIDTENAVRFPFLRTIGVDTEDNFIYVSENRLENIFTIIENIIVEIRESDRDSKFTTIVVDSIAGATTKKEFEEDYEKGGYNTDKAIVLSKALRKVTNMFGREQVLFVFTNQLRDNVGGGMFAPDYTTPGGRAVPHHSSVRIRMKNTSKIRATGPRGKQTVGAKLRPYVEKNRLAPPKQECEFDLYFDSGIDDISSIFEELKNINAAYHKGAGWYNLMLEDEDGEREVKWSHPEEDGDDPYTFRGTEFKETLMGDDVFREKVFEELHKGVLVDYEENWADTSDIEYVSNDNGEGEAEDEEV